MTAVTRSTISDFFDSMYGDLVSVEAQIILWSPVKGASILWCSDIDSATDVAQANSKRIDTYYQPCLHNPSLMKQEALRLSRERSEHISTELRHRRGYHQSVVVMPGVWVDIDTLEGDHKAADDPNNVLPKTTDDVVRMLKALPAQATAIIKTGGGVHAYWRFDEPWELRNDKDRDDARDLSYAWQIGVVETAMLARGWNALDHTFDLPRVMRVPGTYNRKYDPPRKVRIIGGDSTACYGRDDLHSYAPEECQQAPNRIGSAGRIAMPPVDPDAEPSPLVKGLMEIHSDFKFSWDGTTSYKSQSERDMAISTFMASAGFGDDAMHEAMVISRRMHGGQDKTNRPDYYRNTIAKARSAKVDGTYALHQAKTSAERTKAEVALSERKLAALEEQVSDSKHALNGGGQRASDARTAIISKIGEYIGLPENQAIIGIEEVCPGGGKRSHYTLVGTPGRVELGEMIAFQRTNIFDAAIRELFRVPMKSMRKKEWDVVHGLLLRVIDTVDISDDGTYIGETEAAIRVLIEHKCAGTPVTDRYTAIHNAVPWMEEEAIYICSEQAVEDIHKLSNYKWSLREFCRRLKTMNAEPKRMKVGVKETVKDKRKSRSVWKLPYPAEYWL